MPKILITLIKKDKDLIININIDNLSKGLTSEGVNMPSYRNPDYASFKTRMNPSNRGFWDLTLTRNFIKNIDLKIDEKDVGFIQKLDNKKTKFIFNRVPEEFALGMTIEQWDKYKENLYKLALEEIKKMIKL
ncbi:hypothetical protein [uncultured Mediterranean phage uvMED]|nr:hypothetical protein [uncultured Mediterranean phage uvMED]